MINKRLLVKALLAHNDENSFYDKKLKVDLSHREGKAKFLKHICALSNSNPANNSYIVIGVSDQNNTILGVDFFDDSKIQNLINAYLENPPRVSYENIPFPHLPVGKVVGLVTIMPNSERTSLQKNIWKYEKGSVFIREGSISIPKNTAFENSSHNRGIVEEIENHAQNNIQLTLDGVVDFLGAHGKPLTTEYKVFQETFVVCWAGMKKTVKDRTYFSRVDIELINEQVKLFYSNLDEVEIEWTPQEFKITEYVRLQIQNTFKFFPLEQVQIQFSQNGSYNLNTRLLFEPPRLDKAYLLHRFNANTSLLDRLENKLPLNPLEEADLYQLPSSYMLCFFNSIEDAKGQLQRAKPLLKAYDENIYKVYKETERILRKIKYN